MEPQNNKTQPGEMPPKEEVEKMFADAICKKVPEAAIYRKDFKYKWEGTSIELDPTCIPEHIFLKIVMAYP